MTAKPWGADVDCDFAAAAGHINAQHGRMVTAAEWLLANTGEWQGDGLWTAEAYVTWRTGIARGTASKIVDIARRADEFPDCVTAMRRGELSLDQMAPIVRHAPSWADAQMSGLATRLTVAQISKVAREYTWDNDGSGRTPTDDATPHGSRVGEHGAGEHGGTLHVGTTGGGGEATGDDPPGNVGPSASVEPPDRAWFGWDDHGRFRLNLDVGADSGALIETALHECRDHLFDERTDTDSVSTVEAVLEMAARSIDTIASPARQSRFRVNVHVDTSTGRTTDGRGRPVPDGPADRITCDAIVSEVRTEKGVPVSVGRSRHIVPDRTRRLIEHRDGGCRVPGCHSDRFVEVHHVIHWSRGGPTDTVNLISLCPKHHRLHHQGRLGVTGNADRPPDTPGAVAFTDKRGVVLRESGSAPEPPDEPPPPIEGTWEHPLGERLDMRWLHFNDDPNGPEKVVVSTDSP